MFLAAAGIGFTFLPSCGGGKGENTKEVMTLNNMATGGKYFRFVNGVDYMEVVPLGGYESKYDNGDGTGSVEAATCEFHFSNPVSVGGDEIVTYTVTEAENGVPTKAKITFLGFSLENQTDQGFLSFFGFQKTYGDTTITSLIFLQGTLVFEIDFNSGTAEMVYHTDEYTYTNQEDGTIHVSQDGEEKRIGITFVVLQR